MLRSTFLVILIVLYVNLHETKGKYVEGELDTNSDWEFLTRFCFLSTKGTLKFTFEYPTTYGPQHILLYFDTPDQWDSVYKSDKTCALKKSVLHPDNNQVIELVSSFGMSGCSIQKIDGIQKFLCKGGRVFRSSRERWWFIAVSRCEQDVNGNCTERELVLKPENNQKIVLLDTVSSSGCAKHVIEGVESYKCVGGRTFRAARERWWYIAASHCRPLTPTGIKLKYKIHMTNGEEGDYLHREYSADEFYILPIDIAFLVVYVILCIMTVICAIFLRNRQLWHTTYKMYMISVFLYTFYLFLMSVGYGIYGDDGIDYKLIGTKYAARSFESLSIMIFLLMLILVGKGYTITRGRLSTVSTIKITVFMTLYTIVYVIIFVWEGIMFDPGLVLYLYESPPGYALIAMRIIGFIWFCYAIFFTLKHYPEKGKFYYPLFVFYTLWFWAGPIVIIVAMTSIALWSREKTVHGVECFVSFLGHIVFLILTRPSAANQNFPYHVRTTQIGILQNVPHVPEGTTTMENGSFGAHAYAVSNPMASSSSGPDLSGLFVTSKTRSDEKETSLNNNEYSSNNVPPPSFATTRGGGGGGRGGGSHPPRAFNRGNRLNSTAMLINPGDDDVDDVPDFPAPSAPTSPASPPPTYETLFRAQSQSGNNN